MSDLSTNEDSVIEFIERVRSIADCMEDLCLHGGCWQFHLLLKSVFDSAVPHWNVEHVITEIAGEYYDIRGLVDSEGYVPMPEDAVDYAHSWLPEYRMTVFGLE